MLSMRLVRSSALVDIGRIASLHYLRQDGAGLTIGALVRHQEIVTSDVVRACCPLLAEAAAQIGHLHIRNRGTIGGSLAHADPAAEYLTAALALEASVRLVGPTGARSLAIRDFVVGPLATALRPDEVLVEVRVALPPRGAGWAFRELVQRSGDFALAEVAVLVAGRDGSDEVEAARIAVGAVTDMPVRCVRTEERLQGRVLDRDLAAAAGRWAAAELEAPVSDIHAPGEYRVEVTGYLVRDALVGAWARRGSPDGRRR
jgi:carbon-monoxide dehydrogenase medium subunit